MKKPGHTTIPYPRIRKATVDLLTAAKRKSGGYYSFTGYIIRCVAEAVERNKIVHAYRNMRGRLVLFDDDGMYIPHDLRRKRIEGKRYRCRSPERAG